MSTTTVRIIIVLVILILVIISTFLLIDFPAQQIEKPADAIQTEELNAEKIAGRWQRTDGGYVIEVRAVHNDGIMDASYFNPNPINVSKAEWSTMDGRLNIFIELSDVNYPGSNYKLSYFPGQDQLVGIYHQAVYNQNYEVQFVRVPNE